MRRLLLEAAAEAERVVLAHGSKGAIEKTRARQAVAALRQVSLDTWGEVDGITRAGVKAAAKSAALSERWMSRTLEAKFGESIPEWEKAIGYSAQNGIDALLAKQKNAIPLSERVYHARALTDGKVDDTVSRGLLLQKSAAQIAKDVRQYISPDTPGGTSYAANRLARTEINNAFHTQQVASRAEEPWTQSFTWNISGSHPKPDECNEYGEKTHFTGGQPGEYRVGDVPGKPHPNCLCYVTTNTIDEDEFVDSFMAGKYNSYMDSRIYGSGIPVPC